MRFFYNLPIKICVGILVLFFIESQAGNNLRINAGASNPKTARWSSKPNWISELSREERKKLCGAIIAPVEYATLLTIPTNDTLPAQFDWRNHSGNWLTSVKNQGMCGSCWAFTAIAQTESWWKILKNRLDVDLDLSEQFILSCSDGNCEGGMINQALELIKTDGIPIESCFPYRENDSIACEDACDNWIDNAITIPGRVTVSTLSLDMVKRAIMRQPVSTTMNVYDNFSGYNSGVYDEVDGDFIGGHAVLLVGWDDRERCWIVKNSWGADWGEQGYFRISWGISDIAGAIDYIWNCVTCTPAIVVQPEILNYTLNCGDSIQTKFTIKNESSENLEYFIKVYKPLVKLSENDYNHFSLIYEHESFIDNSSKNEPPPWLGISGRMGNIGGKDSAKIKVQINAKSLDIGEYKRVLCIVSNDTTQPVVYLRIELTVDQPELVLSAITKPGSFKLEQNYPNPFNSTTTIKFKVPIADFVELSIFNMLGQKLTTLIKGKKPAGNYRVQWDGQDFVSGVYYYRLTSGLHVQTKKMVLLR